jgi:hypothetical protein
LCWAFIPIFTTSTFFTVLFRIYEPRNFLGMREHLKVDKNENKNEEKKMATTNKENKKLK